MGCSDPRDGASYDDAYASGRRDGLNAVGNVGDIVKRNDDLLKKNSAFVRRVDWLESALCAIFNELLRRDNPEDFIASAEKGSDMRLMSFWEDHSDRDEARIARKLKSFSMDELQVIKTILDRGFGPD